MKISLVYDWFGEGAGGGEKTFEAIYDAFSAPIYTLLKNAKSVERYSFRDEKIYSSFIEKLPFAQTKYRSYLPFFPLAIEQFDLSTYDLILSCSHCVAKGVMVHPDQLHLCYCYTPMRYAWDLYHQYLRESGLVKGLKAAFVKACLHYLRIWDAQSASRVDQFGAISHYVAKRIRKIYGREAHVIYPPVDTNFFVPGDVREHFYLAASRLVPYKKMDLIVEAFSRMPDKRLVVIGDGPDLTKIKGKAKSNIEILGYQPDLVLREYLQRAKAFVFAAIEDFGILPLEAQACGTPVIALNKGAVKETVEEGVTGIFFQEQHPVSLISAVQAFEREQDRFKPEGIREYALKFNRDRFIAEYRNWVQTEWEVFQERGRLCESFY